MEKLIINEHSSIKIYIRNKIFYFDPFNINEEYKDANYILITHDHYDHFDFKSIKKISNDNTIIIYPKSIDEKIYNQINKFVFKKIIKMSQNDNIVLKENNFDIKITTIPAYNIGKNFHKKEFGYVGYILDIDDKKYYVLGDTDITEDNKNIKCDIMFIPIGGTYTMDYKQAAEYVNRIKPKIAVPIHYGTVVGDINLGNEFKKLVNTDINVLIKI